MDISSCTAIVTGGASGIGLACAQLLTARGAECVLVDRNAELGEVVAKELPGHFVAADVANEVEVAAAVGLAAELGPLRIVVNAAGIGNPGRILDRDLTPLSLDKFERVLRVNLIGTFNVMRLAAQAMAATEPLDEYGNRGSIVNLASVAAFDGQIGQAAYSASKGGIVGLTLPAARDLASVGIRVNTVAPGLIDTPIYGQGERAEEFKGRLIKDVLFPHRLGLATEVASMVVEVIANGYMNGETIRVDAGIRMPPK